MAVEGPTMTPDVFWDTIQVRGYLLMSLRPLEVIMAHYTRLLTEAQLEDVIEARDLLTHLYATLCQEKP
jgi:hypothetical protein